MIWLLLACLPHSNPCDVEAPSYPAGCEALDSVDSGLGDTAEAVDTGNTDSSRDDDPVRNMSVEGYREREFSATRSSAPDDTDLNELNSSRDSRHHSRASQDPKSGAPTLLPE